MSSSANQYPVVNLSDLMDIQGGAQPPTKTFLKEPKSGYVRFVQIRDFETDNHLTYIKDDSKWRHCSKDDVLIARYGASVGRMCRGVEGAYNVALAKVIPKSTDLNFLYYLLRSDWFQLPIAAMSGRSAQAGFNKGDIAAIRVPCPPQGVQKAIGKILSEIDNRIALLRDTNTLLEQIAQTIFKSWFVDFDPIRAKQEGRIPEGMDEETASLFPDSFEESELGIVPRGWSPVRLDTFIELAYGKALKAENRLHGDVPVYGSGGITGWHDTPLVDHPSIIVGRKGTVGSIYWESRPFYPIDTVFYVRTKKPLSYCHQLLTRLGLHDMNTDAAVPGLNRDNVYRLLVPDAPAQILTEFDGVMTCIRTVLDHNLEQAPTSATPCSRA